MNNLKKNKLQRRAKRLYVLCVCLTLVMAVAIMPAFAAASPAPGGDLLNVVNNLSDFIFSLIRSVGLVLLGYGVLQVGLSLQSHDPSQRSNGMLTIAAFLSCSKIYRYLRLIFTISGAYRSGAFCLDVLTGLSMTGTRS